MSLSVRRLLALALVLTAQVAAGHDWAQWRGPTENGVAYEKNLPDATKQVLWKIPYGGRSTPVVVGGRVFAINLAGEGILQQERVFCADLASGKILWEHKFNVFHTDIPNSRVGWASLAADPETGYVYANGVQGMFLCLDRDGKLIWSRSLTELYGRISGYGGRTQTPLVDEDRVIVGFNNSSFGPHAIGAQRYLAMDKRTGEVVWWSTPGTKPEDSTYSNPIAAVIGGQRLIIGGNADGWLHAINARTGERVWSFHLSQRGLNVTPVVDGYRVYIAHSEENLDSTAMGRVVCIDGRGHGDVTKTHELWRADGVDAGYASPLLQNGRLYVMSNAGQLYCFDGGSGKEIWRYTAGRIGKGSPVFGDGKIYLTTANGDFVILQDAGKEAKELDRATYAQEGKAGIELFGSPAVSNGRVVFFNTTEMICLGKTDAQPQDLPVPPEPAEPPADANAAAAHLQIRPAEVLLAPGQTVQFKAIAFDALGRPLRQVEPQWSFSTPGGAIDPTGKFTAGKTGAIGEATAKLDSLAGTARVRIVPPLPISEDFEKRTEGDGIGWWVGVSKGKYAIETLEGNKVLKKIADERGPIFNRSHGFITPPLAPGYTVQADVMGQKTGRRRGDVGLINDRYVLELFGGVQRLRVVSWVPAPRFEKRVDFKWEPGRWYTMKLRVDVADGKALVRAKAWPRGEAEPAAWTIEAEDPQPNLEGAAGIYANSMAPLYFDNVKIYRD